MRARLLVFPMKGRNWCFTKSVDRHLPELDSAHYPTTLTQLWKKISSNSSKPIIDNAELLIDFVSKKMNRAWLGLENAGEGTVKKKIHGLGLSLLARVKPSELFLKSISKEITQVDITYPSSLNDRLVRRRLRHIATRGAIIHRKYFYGSVILLPFTTAFTILPLPNIPFFWVLFRTYSHWRALQGSERLLQLLSNFSVAQKSTVFNTEQNESEHDNSNRETRNPHLYLSVLQPSDELQKLLCQDINEGLSQDTIRNICKTFDLHEIEIVKYKDTM